MDAEQPAGIDFISQPWEDLLDELVGAAREHLILVAPFIKKHPLRRISKLLSELPSGSRPQITILTNLDWNSLLQDTLEISALVEFVEQVQTVSVYSLSSLHAKIYLADQNKAIVTSANLTLRGLRSNTEYGVIIRDLDMVNRIHQDVDSFLANSQLISYEELRKLCKKVIDDPDYRPIHIPVVKREATPITITPEPHGGDTEYEEADENSHILTKEKEYFDAVDDKDWVRVFELEVGPYQSLSRKDTIHLAEAIQKGDKKARIELINRRLAKVIELAKYRLFEGLPLLDIIQEGAIGLMKAVDNFDLKKGHNFHGYGDESITWNIIRALNNKSRTIRLPIHLQDQFSKHQNLLSKYLIERNTSISLEEFAAICDIDLKKFTPLLRFTMPPLDIDKTLDEEDGIHPWEALLAVDSEEVFQQDDFTFLADMLDPFGNFIPRLLQIRKQLIESAGLSSGCEMRLGDLIINEEVDVEKDTETQLMKRDLHSALSNLPKREACILRMRFGLDEDIQVFTLEELGKRLKVTRERVRQIEKQALTRLRNSSAATDLRAYLNA